MYVCTYVCVCVCVCIYIYIYIYVCMYVFRVLTLSRAVYRSHLRDFPGRCGRITYDGQLKHAKLGQLAVAYRASQFSW